MRSGHTQDSIDNEFIQAIKDGDQVRAEFYLDGDVLMFNASKLALNQAVVMTVRSNQVEMTRWLLSKGADADQLAKPETSISLLQYAAHYDNADIVECLLPHIKNIDHLSKHGQTALHYAIERRNTRICSLLIQHNASLDCRTTDHKNRLIRSQIGMILKKGCIEIARELLTYNPSALTKFQETYPNIINYICKEPDADIATLSNMIEFLIREVPAAFIVEDLTLCKDNVLETGTTMEASGIPAELFFLYKARLELNAFFLTIQNSAGANTSKRLNDGLHCITAHNPHLLANDLLIILAGMHPIISKERFKQIFFELLAPFISPAKSSVSMRFGFMLYHACDVLLHSDLKDSEQTQIIGKLTLLTLLQTILHGKEDVYSQIVALMKQMIPATKEFLSRERGEIMLNTYIQQYPTEIAEFVNQLKTFYREHLRIMLSAGQDNPCYRIEMMLLANELKRSQAETKAAEKVIEAQMKTISSLQSQNTLLSDERNILLNSFLASDTKMSEIKLTNHELQAEIARQRDHILSLESERTALRIQLEVSRQEPDHSPIKKPKKVAKSKKREHVPESDDPAAAPPIKNRAFFEAQGPAAPRPAARITRAATSKNKL